MKRGRKVGQEPDHVRNLDFHFPKSNWKSLNAF